MVRLSLYPCRGVKAAINTHSRHHFPYLFRLMSNNVRASKLIVFPALLVLLYSIVGVHVLHPVFHDHSHQSHHSDCSIHQQQKGYNHDFSTEPQQHDCCPICVFLLSVQFHHPSLFRFTIPAGTPYSTLVNKKNSVKWVDQRFHDIRGPPHLPLLT